MKSRFVTRTLVLVAFSFPRLVAQEPAQPSESGKQAAQPMVYDLYDLINRPADAGHRPGIAGASELELIRCLVKNLGLGPEQPIELLNKNQLVITATAKEHGEVTELLSAVRRQRQDFVIMNARLYEVDADFFSREVAPLFRRRGGPEKVPAIVQIKGALFNKIRAQRLLLKGDDSKIVPGSETLFLSKESIIRFAEAPEPGQKGATAGVALAGVSFRVQPLVSADRRYLRLRVSQDVSRLIGMERTKKPDPAAGEGAEVEIEVPNIRKDLVIDTVTTPDSEPILLPVAYRPPEKEKRNKIWLLMARPFIWIDEEVRQRRADGADFTPQTVWDSEVAPEQPEVPAVPVP